MSKSKGFKPADKFKPIDKKTLIKWIDAYCNGDRSKGKIGDWDVSHITDMSRLFYFKNLQDSLNNWDVSNVTNMSEMFAGCKKFNQPLETWNVSNVTNMSEMFAECNKFNQPLDRWNVSNVTNMHAMFRFCRSFNQPLNTWNVSNVTNMYAMFNSCDEFNQPLNTWNVSNVTNMSGMFKDCIQFNQPLDTWNVSNVTDMRFMFLNCTNFNQPLDTWNVSNVTNMFCMFKNCTNFNQPLNTWNVSNVTNMSRMFENCTNFNQPLDTWNINVAINWQDVSNQPFILNSRPTSRSTQSIPLITFPPLHELPRLEEMTIPSSTEVIDVVYGDINFAYYVNMSNETTDEIPEMDRSDNIVFYVNNSFQGVQKSRLRELIENRTGDSGLYYECRKPDSMNPDNIIKNNPLFYLQKVSSISYFVPANEILTILDSNDKLYTLHNKMHDLASVVSQSIYDRHRLGDTQSGISASHCQTGQEGELYSLAVKPFSLNLKRTSEQSEENENPKKKTKIGGKKLKKTNKKYRKINKKSRKMKKK
jgi:surface protein